LKYNFFNTLRGNILIFVILSSFIPLLFLGTISYITSIKAIKDEANILTKNIMEEKLSHIYTLMNQSENLIRSIVENKKFIQIIKNTGKNESFDRLSTQSVIGNLLGSYLHMEGLISINISLLDGRNFNVGKLFQSGKVNLDLRDKLLNKALIDKYKLYWSGIAENILLNSSNKYVIPAVMAITKLDENTMEDIPLGILQLTFGIDSFYKSMKSNYKDNIYFILIDNNYNILSHKNQKSVNTKLDAEVQKRLVGNLGKFSFSLDGENSQILYQKLTDNNFMLLGIIPTKPQEKMIEKIAIYTIGLVLFAIIILLLSIYYISKNMLIPMQNITNSFKQVEKNHFDNISIANSNIKEIRELKYGLTSYITTAKTVFEVSYNLEKSHKNIKDSIKFASLIQNALLPNNAILDSFTQDNLVFWQPRDTVGGDIYLATELDSENEIIIMVIDGAGHGVPGAFVTMLVKAIETQIIGEIKLGLLEPSPALILEYFNMAIKVMLKQEKGSKSNTGFDGGILYYNKETNICKYAGAKTPLYIVQDGKLEILKSDRKNVGFVRTKLDQKYTEYDIEIKSGTQIYLCTDGIIDQEGENNSRYGKSRFEKLILENSDKTFTEQRNSIVADFENFQSDFEQSDDITVLGLKF